MAIDFARAGAISRGDGRNAVAAAAYIGRERLIDENTGELFRYRHKNTADLEYKEIILPDGVDVKFLDPAKLWSEAEMAERRKDSVVAREYVLSLPADKEIDLGHRIALAREFAIEHFVSKGIPVQICLHLPHGSTSDSDARNFHAHILRTTRRFDGDRLSSHKAMDLEPKHKFINGRGLIVESDEWNLKWRGAQEAYFEKHGISLTVDINAPIPHEHIGPRRSWADGDPRVKNVPKIRAANAAILRDPTAVVEHLERQPPNQKVTPQSIAKLLAKHLPPGERAKVTAQVEHRIQRLQRAKLEEAARADMVQSRLRPLSVEDVARQISLEYAARIAEANKFREEAQRLEHEIYRAGLHKEVSEIRRDNRKREMGIARKAMNKAGLSDPELYRWERDARISGKTVERNKTHLSHALARLDSLTKAAAKLLDPPNPEPGVQTLRQLAEAELAVRKRVALNAQDILRPIQKAEQAERLTVQNRVRATAKSELSKAERERQKIAPTQKL